jgi:hypothetical protein
MTISVKPEDMYYMESHPHSGQNRAASKLIRELLSSAPLVAASDNAELVRLQTAIEHVRQQAGIWKQEARTQCGIVRRILETLGLPTNDWEFAATPSTIKAEPTGEQL